MQNFRILYWNKCQIFSDFNGENKYGSRDDRTGPESGLITELQSPRFFTEIANGVSNVQ